MSNIQKNQSLNIAFTIPTPCTAIAQKRNSWLFIRLSQVLFKSFIIFKNLKNIRKTKTCREQGILDKIFWFGEQFYISIHFKHNLSCFEVFNYTESILITLFEDFIVQIVLAGRSQISWMGTKEKRRREGRREEAEGLTRIQNIRTVKRIWPAFLFLLFSLSFTSLFQIQPMNWLFGFIVHQNQTGFIYHNIVGMSW